MVVNFIVHCVYVCCMARARVSRPTSDTRHQTTVFTLFTPVEEMMVTHLPI